MPDLPILDRVVHLDERSRNFGVRELIGTTPRYKRVWQSRKQGPLDQGREGRCVIFGWGAELASTPWKYQINNAWCNTKWPLVQAEDRKMGNNWSDGASVLAGAKTCKAEGAISRYYWAFGIDDVIDCLVRRGPIVLGVNWTDSMYQTSTDGLVKVEGPVIGGHCIMANGYWPRHPQFGDVIVWTNSWGNGYGHFGRGYIRVPDLDKLLKQDGEACIGVDAPIKVQP